jgi:serine/threonine protein kinase
VHRCPTCGKQLEDSIRFCPEDGTPLSDTAAARAAPTPTTAPRQPRSQVLELPLLLDNRYRLDELRGGGGMAKVYKATDQRFERTVAVKIINPELRHDPEFDARFQREARIVSQLSDPHIVVVHDFGIDPQHGPYLVMEYLQGQTLRERISAQGALPARAAIQLGGQILLALIHAHGKNVVHRDIKPDNIFLLNQSGVRLHVRVLDFGIARIFRGDDKEQAAQLTHPGAVLGTPRYMSPEQLAGHAVDARSDLYSSAMVLHEAMTGQLPFLSGKKLCELCPDAPQGLQEILESCLKPNAAERPQSAVDLYLRLQEMGKASGILLLPPGTLERMLKERAEQHEASTLKYSAGVPKWKWWYLALAAAGLIVVAGLVWLLFLRS